MFSYLSTKSSGALKTTPLSTRHIPYTNLLLKCGYKSLYKDRPNVYRWLKRIIKRDSVQYIINQTPDVEEKEANIEKQEKDLSKRVDKLVLDKQLDMDKEERENKRNKRTNKVK